MSHGTTTQAQRWQRPVREAFPSIWESAEARVDYASGMRNTGSSRRPTGVAPRASMRRAA